MRSIYLQHFLLIPLVVSDFCSKSKNKNKDNNSKIRQDRVMVFIQCTSSQ